MLDTNVLVAAVLVPTGTSARLFEAWRQQHFVLVTSEPLLAELEGVLKRPRLARYGPRSPEEKRQFVGVVRRGAEVVAGVVEVAVVRADPADNAVLAAAVEGKADFVVTGDRKHLLPLKQYQGIPIVSPAGFLAQLPPP